MRVSVLSTPWYANMVNYLVTVAGISFGINLPFENNVLILLSRVVCLTLRLNLFSNFSIQWRVEAIIKAKVLLEKS